MDNFGLGLQLHWKNVYITGVFLWTLLNPSKQFFKRTSVDSYFQMTIKWNDSHLWKVTIISKITTFLIFWKIPHIEWLIEFQKLGLGSGTWLVKVSWVGQFLHSNVLSKTIPKPRYPLNLSIPVLDEEKQIIHIFISSFLVVPQKNIWRP